MIADVTDLCVHKYGEKENKSTCTTARAPPTGQGSYSRGFDPSLLVQRIGRLFESILIARLEAKYDMGPAHETAIRAVVIL